MIPVKNPVAITRSQTSTQVKTEEQLKRLCLERGRLIKPRHATIIDSH